MVLAMIEALGHLVYNMSPETAWYLWGWRDRTTMEWWMVKAFGNSLPNEAASRNYWSGYIGMDFPDD